MSVQTPIEVLERALAQSEAWDAQKADHTTPDRDLAFTTEKRIGLMGTTRSISKDGLNHLCDALKHTTANKKPLPATFLREGTTGDVFALTLAEHAGLSEKSHMHRTFDGGIEAVVSEAWPRFGGTDYENTFMLRQILTVCKSIPPVSLKMHTHSPGTIVAKIAFRQDQINIGSMTGQADRAVEQGVMFKNGEWRDRSIAIVPYIKTSNCDNSTVIDLTGWGFKMPHVGRPEKFVNAIADGLTAALQNAPALVEAMAIGARLPVENIEKLIAGMVKEAKLPDGVAMVAMRGIGLQQPSVLAVHDALTYAAHASEIGEDDGLLLEFFASKYLIARTGVRPKVVVGSERMVGEHDPYGNRFAAVDYDLQPVEVSAE